MSSSSSSSSLISNDGIHHIDKRLGLYMRAAYSLSSLRAIVEELVLNAIDANASNIDISLNDNKYDILIRDNGYGFSYNDMEQLGQWNITSKSLPSSSSSSYGFRGEALASIISISDVTIISRYQGHHTAYSKTFIQGNSTAPCKVSTERFLPSCSGTYIVLSNVFFNMSVRKISMNKVTETSNIKKFVEIMALLHNAINWQLSDNKKRIVHLPAHKSVYDRFSHLYGSDKSNNMIQVIESFGGYTLTGLISPPISDKCHWNRDYQFFYVNHRHLKSSDSVVKALDGCFASALRLDGKGMISRHHNPNNCHPLFVLQLTCEGEFYDVTVEPDKSVILFRSLPLVTEIIMRLLTKIFKDFVVKSDPQYNTMLMLIEKMHKSIKGGNDYKNAINDYNDDINNNIHDINSNNDNSKHINNDHNKDSNNNDNNNNEIYMLRNTTNDNDRHSWSPQTVNFRSAFLQSPDVKSKSSLDFSKYSYNDNDNDNDNNYLEFEETLQYDPSTNTNNTSSSTAVSLLSEFGVSVRRNNNNLYDTMLGVYNDVDDNYYIDDNDNDNIDYSSHRINSTFFDLPEDFSRNDIIRDTVHYSPHSNDSNDSTESIAPQKLSLKRNNELDNDFQRPYEDLSEPIMKKSRSQGDGGSFYNHGSNETMNLTKDMLPSLRIIGQLENSVILATSGDVIVVIDQHAADERIKLEGLTLNFPKDINFLNTDEKFAQQNLKEVDTEISIDLYSATQLNDFRNVILSWGFLFNIKSSGENLSTLHLTRVPVIEGDQLSINDLLEFLHYLDTNSNLPSSACKPPAINRILNNKACKTAIKFGDKLNINQCKKLVTDLSTTVFPFQCAHNRPSIAPLINLSPVIKEQSQNYIHDIQYGNIMKRLYDL